MRVALVGPAEQRRLLRRQLEAGDLEVVLEAETQPVSDVLADLHVDAIVTATPEQAGALLQPRDRDVPVPVEALTPREQNVLALVAEGLPNKAIASALGISDQTVKFHVAAIIGKLGAVNRTDAVRRAVRRGLVAI